MGAIYAQLSLRERRRIKDWWLARAPVAEMARALRRHKSAIFREIKHNFWVDDACPKKYAGYFGMAAYQRTQRKLLRYRELCQHIVASLKNGWTPEQIGNRMIHECTKQRACQETIYRYVYSKEVMAHDL